MNDLGLASGTVSLRAYNPSWAILFDSEKKILQEALKIQSDHIQHVGSTSMPGMISKPILDIALLVDSLEITEDWIKKLSDIGYSYKGIEPDLPDRRFFAKGPRANRTVYLHVVNISEYNSLIKFRDKLIQDSELAEKYSLLKQKLARKNASDRLTYTKAKNEFIKSVLQD